jgi:hypothetical protein
VWLLDPGELVAAEAVSALGAKLAGSGQPVSSRKAAHVISHALIALPALPALIYFSLSQVDVVDCLGTSRLDHHLNYCHSRQRVSFPWLKSAVVVLLFVSTASADTGSPTTEAPADTESKLRLIDELAATLDDVVQRLTALGLNDDSELSTELTDDVSTSEGSLEPPALETEMRDDQSLNEERTVQSSKPLTLPVLSGLEDDRDQAVTARAKAVLKKRFETLKEEMTDAGVVETTPCRSLCR